MALHLRHDWPGMRPDYVDYVEVGGLGVVGACGGCLLIVCSSCVLWLHVVDHPPNPTVNHTNHPQVAIMSAKQNAPSLIPILIYDGPPGSLTAWVERLGGKVIFHYLTFYEDLRKFEKKGVLQEVWWMVAYMCLVLVYPHGHRHTHMIATQYEGASILMSTYTHTHTQTQTHTYTHIHTYTNKNTGFCAECTWYIFAHGHCTFSPWVAQAVWQ